MKDIENDAIQLLKIKNSSSMGRTAGEAETGRPVVTSQNANVFRQQVTDIVVDAVALPERNKEKDKNE